ncbi:hypothetical protein ACFXHA_26970 [Nocardia sp. NPDC059240]|uniref:hypothetical protein n=1 Tax=Nocardia sp. NPDC059240 TaxID=3346786 RepID=UPI00368406D3
MVLDEVWRRLDGVEPLSGPHGGPLRRTVKAILDPLVIRPVQHPQCAGAMLSADGAVLLAARVHAAGDVLRATAAWFTLLKQTRRALRITEGNAQDLYFQRCFELATVSGMPDPARDRAAAEAALREIHGLNAGRTTQALKDYLADQARAADLTALIHTAWRRRPLTDVPDHTRALIELLDACAATRFDDSGGADLESAVAASLGTHTGIQLWLAQPEGGSEWTGGESGRSARELGLTLHPLPEAPRVGGSASTATLGLPFDRTIHERIFTVLQASSERGDLPPLPELVAAEIARACAPWALLDESLRMAAAAGAVLAVSLCPLGDPQIPTGDREAAPEPARAFAGAAVGLVGAAVGLTGTAAGLLGTYAGTTGPVGANGGPSSSGTAGSRGAAGTNGGPRSNGRVGASGTAGSNGGVGSGIAARLVNARWQREAYVLQARRMAVRVDAVEGPLGAIAADLRVPWRPYLRRLWARLHGRDVREFPVYAADELWDLLDGVARSVILDHRMRVKRALAANAEATADDRESRAG